MKPKSLDIALLENALATIEKVLAHADSELQGAPYHGPTANVPLEALRGDPQNEEQRFRASAAQSAINICLSSAAALVDVSQALMSKPAARSRQDLEREWQALITHTKIASRSAYRAALIMAAQRNLLAAQGLVAGEADNLPVLTH
ncbi:hypothetical protein QTH97_03405 [Variovorax sp. J22R24]|uniref:hypothetical protein n=1 Tax=Variovorax gracilis TaxID=3053502 RepID=UPI002578DF81|nr:hypothetical protein [Variovorax sp. J22R24]MDM0103962.1 hypothetical protein [Variovorax sp. J22R24]